MMEASVTDVAKFSFSGGNLTLDFFVNSNPKDGISCHKFIQDKYPITSKKEERISLFIEKLNVKLSGIIDGIHFVNSHIVIEEIKTTSINVDKINEDYHKEHYGQLLLYSYMYMINNELTEIKANLNYINIIDYSNKKIDYEFKLVDISSVVFDALSKYIEWL